MRSKRLKKEKKVKANKKNSKKNVSAPFDDQSVNRKSINRMKNTISKGVSDVA